MNSGLGVSVRDLLKSGEAPLGFGVESCGEAAPAELPETGVTDWLTAGDEVWDSELSVLMVPAEVFASVNISVAVGDCAEGNGTLLDPDKESSGLDSATCCPPMTKYKLWILMEKIINFI